MNSVPFSVIGHVRSCFTEKFGTPRQPGIVPSARAELVFEPEYRNADAIRGLEDFSHVWLLFLFHKTAAQGWRPTVRPPRLGGNERKGVFATRSPFRPNPIGLSAVKLDGIDTTVPHGPVLLLSGTDIVDGTPVLDVKPYLPFADSLPEARGGFARQAPEPVPVVIPPGAEAACTPAQLAVIRETLSADPRPAYHDDGQRLYGLSLDGLNIRWRCAGGAIHVESISPLP